MASKELSFSEWCDRKFTNMYSHQEFASPRKKPIAQQTPIKARFQTTSAKQDRYHTDSLGDKDHRRLAQSPTLSCSEGKARMQGKFHLQEVQSYSTERWPKISPKLPDKDVKPAAARWCDKMKSLSVSEDYLAGESKLEAFGDDGHHEKTKVSPRNQVKKALKLNSEDIPDEMKANKTVASRVSVDSGSSGQESHASKRTFSELSPGRKQAKSRLWKKRPRSLGICPKKTDELQQQAVCSPSFSTDDWGCSKMSSGGDVTRMVTVEKTSDQKTKTQETPDASTKKGSSTMQEKQKMVESIPVKPKRRNSSGKVKFQIKSKKKVLKNSQVDGKNEQHLPEKLGGESTSPAGQKAVGGSQISEDSTVARTEETKWKGHSVLAATHTDSSNSRNQVEALAQKKQESAKEKPPKGKAVTKVTHRKDKKKSQRDKSSEHEPVKRVPSGEYDVESSVESEATRYETHFVKVSLSVDDGPRISNNEEKDTKVCRIVTADQGSKSGPVQHACEQLSKSSSKIGKSGKAKVHTEQKSKSEDCESNPKEMNVKCKMENLSPPPATTSQVTSPVTAISSVKSTPRTKHAVAKKVQNDKKATKDKSADCRSPSPRDKSSFGAGLFTKRVLDSVLKPLSVSRSSAKLRPKSAESAKTSRGTDRAGHVQRKSSWPTSKVRLEHLYQTCDDAVSSGSEEELEAEPPICKKSTATSKECQEFQQWQSQKNHQIQHQTENQMKPQPDKFSDKGAENDKRECCTKSQQSTSANVDCRSTEPTKSVPAVSFTPQLIPRSVSRNQRKASLSQDKSEMSSPALDKNSEDVAGASVLERTKSKNDYIIDWLDKQDQPWTESSRESRSQDLEPGEVLDGSSSSDEAWEQLVDNIMKGNNEEIFSTPYCKRVQQKRHATGLRSITPFRSSSFPIELEFKPRITTSQKNVATVSPYYIHPPAPQPTCMTSSACTWSGPMPDFIDGHHSLDPTAPPFDQFSSIQKSSDVNHGMDAMGGFPVFQGKAVNTKTTAASALERAPGNYPGNEDSSPNIMHFDAIPTSSTGNTQKNKHVSNVPPRFLRLTQLQASSGQPVSVHVSSRPPSSPGCVYSKGVRRENLVSTLTTSSLMPESSTSSLSVMTSKAASRSWTLGSLGWTSSLTRTPGTITPTRFTPWTNEVSTPSPWKTYHASKDTVELSPIVDYPVSSVPYIDTHCHIDFLYQRSEFHGTFEKFSKVHNFPPNFAGCLAVFCTPEGFEQGALWKDLAMEKNIWMAFGCHPHHAKSYDGIVEENIIRCMRHPKAIALGEIGLDYSNRCTSDRPLQLEVFRRQLQIALQMGKPLVIHSRDAEYDTLSIMKEVVPRNYKIHRHCFTGSPQEARNFFQAFPNSFIGLTALVTFPSAYPVHRTAIEIPLGKILLETDAPYFLPKQCPRVLRWANPSMAIFVAARIAQLRGLPLDEVLYAVRRNTTEMYGI